MLGLTGCDTSHDHESWVYKNEILCINGSITGSTLYAFEQDMVPRKIETIILNSGGGTWYGGVEVSKLVTNTQIVVADNGRCASNCVMLLAASPKIYVSKKSKIGVHFVYVIKDGQLMVDFDYTQEYFEKIGLPHLYQDYVSYILKNNLATNQEIQNKKIVRPLLENWSQKSIMEIPVDKLKYYGINKNVTIID